MGKHLQDFEEGSDRVQLVLKGPWSLCGELTMGGTSQEVCHCTPGVTWSVFGLWEIGFKERKHIPSKECEWHEGGTAAWVSPALASHGNSAWHVDIH